MRPTASQMLEVLQGSHLRGIIGRSKRYCKTNHEDYSDNHHPPQQPIALAWQPALQTHRVGLTSIRHILSTSYIYSKFAKQIKLACQMSKSDIGNSWHKIGKLEMQSILKKL